MTGDLARAKDRAASEERARAERAGQPYGADVAAHLPDTTWSGDPHSPEGWGRHTARINSVLGSQSARYPVGYQPDSFQIEDDDEGHVNE